MASDAYLLDFNQQAVRIAIHPDGFYMLEMTARFALHPKLLTRTAPVSAKPRVERLQKGLAVHIGNHEHLPVFRVLNHCRYQAVRVKFKIIYPLHTQFTWTLMDAVLGCFIPYGSAIVSVTT